MHVEGPGRPPLPRRMALVVALVLLSPVCAEYLIGYDQIIGRPLELLGGLLILAPLYGLGAAIIFREHTRDFMASPAQLGATAVIAVLLGIAAFALPRRSAPVPGRVPPPWLVGCGAVMLWGTKQLAPASWAGVALAALALTLAAGCLLRYSGRCGWSHRHVLAAGGAALLVNSALAFVVEPLGETSYPAKYAVNTTLLLGVLLLLALIDRRLRRSVAPARMES